MKLFKKFKLLITAFHICLLFTVPVTVIAQADYSCDTYGAGTYQGNTCAETEGGTSSTSGASKGRLSETGKNILIFGGIGLIGAAGGTAILIYLLKRKRKDDLQQ